jgi:cytochrome P450
VACAPRRPRPRAWDDPLRFDPDRFLVASDEQRRLADIVWVPFGRGARNCIGFAPAQMELTLIIAQIAQRLDVTSTASQIRQPVGMAVNRPAGGALMSVSARRP